MIKDVEKNKKYLKKRKTTYFWGPGGVTLSHKDGDDWGMVNTTLFSPNELPENQGATGIIKLLAPHHAVVNDGCESHQVPGVAAARRRAHWKIQRSSG